MTSVTGAPRSARDHLTRSETGPDESSIVSPMAAVANAIARATGVRIARLPMTPAVIVDAVKKNGKAR